MPKPNLEIKGLIPPIIASGASFDRSGRYRYSLYRQFDSGEGILTMIMLNPSTADAQYNDPTITRCIRFAHGNGFKQLTVVNLFAFRATAPIDLKKARNPVGSENNTFIEQAATASALTLVAWGNHGQFRSRDVEVLKLLQSCALHCLGTNKGGSPKHPLYVPANQKLLIYR
jgi:hypothetical protein